MTDTQIRIAVAEELGWKVAGKPTPTLWFGNSPETLRDYTPDCNIGPQADEVPDYPKDLNACVEMEKALKKTQRCFYTDELVNLCGGDYYRLLTATARQRCEAFLRTVGKWID